MSSPFAAQLPVSCANRIEKTCGTAGLVCNDVLPTAKHQRVRVGIVTKNLYYEPRGTVHYNVHFKNGSLENRITERAICGRRPVDIDWIWIVERRRRATPEEVSRLCEISANR